MNFMEIGHRRNLLENQRLNCPTATFHSSWNDKINLTMWVNKDDFATHFLQVFWETTLRTQLVYIYHNLLKNVWLHGPNYEDGLRTFIF